MTETDRETNIETERETEREKERETQKERERERDTIATVTIMSHLPPPLQPLKLPPSALAFPLLHFIMEGRVFVT